MGLDITAYSGLIRCDIQEEDYPNNVYLLDMSRHFSGSMVPLREGWYTYKDSRDCLSLSYGSYNRWRDWLAVQGGHPSAEYVWKFPEGLFSEMINFADNEGTIGTQFCRKLLNDFQKKEAEMSARGNMNCSYFLKVLEGLKLAANGGCLKFH